jgi:hypothetical protein
MKVFKQILFTTALIVAASLGVFAQKGGGGDKKPPKNPPQIRPEDKKPKPPPSNDNRGKKPGSYVLIYGREVSVDLG